MCLGIKKLDQVLKSNPVLQKVLKQLFLPFIPKQKTNPFPLKAQVLLCKPIFGADHTGTWTEVFPTSYIAPPRPLKEICINFHLALKQNLAPDVNPLSSEQKNPIFKSSQNKIQNVHLKKNISQNFSPLKLQSEVTPNWLA